MIDEAMERQVEWLISWLLRIGVMSSTALVVIGMLLIFEHHPQYLSSPADLSALTSTQTAYPHSVSGVLREAGHGHGEGIAMLGLLLLIATPVFRVAVSIVLFARERDRLFVAITTTVLVLLLLSFALGAAGG
jgi:uncharacterized membrane protein